MMNQQPKYHDLKWDTFWDNHVKGCYSYGDYFDHLLSWPHRDDENVLLLKYEDMKTDLPGAISQIASFLGINLSDQVISKIADLSSFEKMKRDDTVNFSSDKNYNREGESTFIRKGIVGDWRNILTATQSTQMDALYTERLVGTSLKFAFP